VFARGGQGGGERRRDRGNEEMNVVSKRYLR